MHAAGGGRAGAKQGCGPEVAAFNGLVAELGGLIPGAAVNLSDAAAASGKGWGLDVQGLQSQPCALQLVLVPFGEEVDPEEWQRYTGETRKLVAASEMTHGSCDRAAQ